ncbi:MAG: hypothetical protein ACYTF3_07335, partial [Planctomycetota bacterium]
MNAWLKVLAPLALLIAGVVLLLGHPRAEAAAGFAAMETGDPLAAAEAYAAAVERKPTRTLLRNLALAALAADELDLAEETAERLAVEGGSSYDVAWRDFLLGNLAWRRSERAELLARGPVPPAGALEQAIAQAEAAAEAWKAADEGRGSLWPEAQRNVARAAARLDALRAMAEASESSQPQAPPEPPPLDETRRQDLMQQLERLDRRREERRPPKPRP